MILALSQPEGWDFEWSRILPGTALHTIFRKNQDKEKSKNLPLNGVPNSQPRYFLKLLFLIVHLLLVRFS